MGYTIHHSVGNGALALPQPSCPSSLPSVQGRMGRKGAVRDNVRSYSMTVAIQEAQVKGPKALDVGPRIRALREGMDLSLRDLGERAGVSAPMLSQVERGETSPTLAIASRIAAGLELSLSQLLRLDEGEGVTVVRRPDRRPGGSRARGHSYELVTPSLPGQRA